VLDSLSGLHLLSGNRVLDVGSGAGLPGVVLAIASPSKQFILCDRSARRARFLKQVKLSLNLSNVVVWEGDLGRDVFPHLTPVDTVVARGVTAADSIWEMAQGYMEAEGKILVYERTQTAPMSCEEEAQPSEDVALEPPLKKYTLNLGGDEVVHQAHYFDIPGINQRHRIVSLYRHTKEVGFS